MAVTYSLLAVPAHWVITLVPHFYSLNLMKRATNGRWNNANPRGSSWSGEIQRTVPANVLATFERARAAHQNGLENLPFFAAALLSAQVAGVDASSINAHAALFLILRVIYTLLYIKISKGKASFARTAVFNLGALTCISLFVRAAFKS